MKPFNLEEALKGAPVKLACGSFYHCYSWSWNRIISWRCVENYSIGGVI